MGKYKAAVITTGGQNLIAQALANEQPLVFTSAKTSSYSYPVGTDIPALTGLQDVLQTVLPFDSKVLGRNVAQVSVRFDNDGVDQTYRIETIGLYAKIEGGEETLFSVTQAITPDEMPVQSDVSPSAYIYNIQHTVQNASQITLTVNPAGTATVQDIMDIENPEFDDSGTVEGISSFPDFLTQLKSKMNFFQFFRDLKAGLQFVLHAGSIVNNCVTDNASLPLSAAQGKILKDLYTQLYSDSQKIKIENQAKNFHIGSLESDGSLFYSRIFKEDYSSYQYTFSDDGLSFWKVDAAGKFSLLWRVATKDDLTTVYIGTVSATSFVTGGTFILRKNNGTVSLSSETGINLSGKQGSGVTIFTLPIGFRPKANLRVPCTALINDESVARELQITPSGTCELQGSDSGSATRIVFNASFCAE